MRIHPVDSSRSQALESISASHSRRRPLSKLQAGNGVGSGREGGFVARNCPICKTSTTLPFETFEGLDLWIACPQCRKKMMPAMLPEGNYGYVCQECEIGIRLSELVPMWDDVGLHGLQARRWKRKRGRESIRSNIQAEPWAAADGPRDKRLSVLWCRTRVRPLLSVVVRRRRAQRMGDYLFHQSYAALMYDEEEDCAARHPSTVGTPRRTPGEWSRLQQPGCGVLGDRSARAGTGRFRRGLPTGPGRSDAG